MITATNQQPLYRTTFASPACESTADVGAAYGGQGRGFRPHELLEAAVATCMNMTVRMHAQKLGMRLASVVTKVDLDRSDPEVAAFRFELDLAGDLSADERHELHRVAARCPVSRTLARDIVVTPAREPA